MVKSIRSPGRSACIVAGVAFLVVLVACGDPYKHSNPYDPAYPVDMTIAGLDTLTYLGQVGQYALQSVPAWPDSGLVWSIDTFTDYFVVPAPMCSSQIALGDTILYGAGNGSYQSIRPPPEPYSFNVPIEVWLGTIDTVEILDECGNPPGSLHRAHRPFARHIAYKTVVVTQRVTRIQLRCPDTHACAPLAVGDTADIWADAFDFGGAPLAALVNGANNPASLNPTLPYVSTDTAVLRVQKGNNPVATFASRDSTIASFTPVGVRVAHVTAVSAGTTWIVATRGALSDSLQVVVH